jgi:arylformamidase
MADPGNSAGFRVARRRLLGVVGVAAVAGPALAEEKPGPPSHPKGPKVFLDYDQVELDAAYDQDAYAANRPQLIQRYASTSDLVRARLGPPQRVAYGPSEIEKLDIYRAAGAKAPIMVFIHGGAPGAPGSPRTAPSLPSSSLPPARISSCRISPPSGRSAAA